MPEYAPFVPPSVLAELVHVEMVRRLAEGLDVPPEVLDGPLRHHHWTTGVPFNVESN